MTPLCIISIGGRAMEKLYFEVPSIKRRDEACEYIREFYEYNSNINGSGGLHRYLASYEAWLEKLEQDYVRVPSEEKVPARTYFLVRACDNKIVGMCNIRLALNGRLKKFAGHIGYSIRPTERRKGYNKTNLYLALKVCDEYGIDKVFMDADLDNVASWKTIEALGGERFKEYFNEEEKCVVVDYTIDVKKALMEHKEYEL